MTDNTAYRSAALVALLADLLVLIALFTVLPLLVERLKVPSGLNTLLIGAAFVLFAIGVFVFRRLEVVPGGSEWLSRRGRIVLSIVFALSMMTMIAWQLGFFNSLGQVNTRELGEGPTAVYFVFAPGAWLGFSLLYILVLAFNVTPSIRETNSAYLVAAFLGLLATGIMLLVTAAQGRVMLGADSNPLWAFAGFVWLLLLFMPPRLIYVYRAIGRGTWALAAAGSLVFLCAVAGAWLALG